MRKLLKEPLIHFILAALTVFVAYELSERHSERRSQTIVISDADLENMAALYTAETGALPPPEDVSAMISDHVRQQVLIREARKLGLQNDDTVIDRRLAQLMEFMVADMVPNQQPSQSELESWYNTHSERFYEPQRISFRHVFISDRSTKDVGAIQKKLNSSEADWIRLGDPFMLQRQYGTLPYREIVRIFGKPFADALFQLELEPVWQGPIRSSLGEHIVQIQERQIATLPPFQDIRQTVLKDWTEHQRRQLNRDAISELISKYDVVIEAINE